MKFISRNFWFSFASLIWMPALVASVFEGRVRIDKSEPGRPDETIRYALKGDLVLTEPRREGAPEVVLLMNLQSRQLTVVQPELRSFKIVPLPDLSDALRKKAASYSPMATGRTTVILGYECTEYHISDGDQTIELWVTDKLKEFMRFPFGNPMILWSLISDSQFFPLRIIVRDSRAVELCKIEVTMIEAGEISPEEFKIIKPHYTKSTSPM